MLGNTNTNINPGYNFEYVYDNRTKTFRLAKVERQRVFIDLDAALEKWRAENKTGEAKTDLGIATVGITEKMEANINMG